MVGSGPLAAVAVHPVVLPGNRRSDPLSFRTEEYRSKGNSNGRGAGCLTAPVAGRRLANEFDLQAKWLTGFVAGSDLR